MPMQSFSSATGTRSLSSKTMQRLPSNLNVFGNSPRNVSTSVVWRVRGEDFGDGCVHRGLLYQLLLHRSDRTQTVEASGVEIQGTPVGGERLGVTPLFHEHVSK